MISFCPCNTINETGAGGISLGSSATVAEEALGGGVSAGGASWVWLDTNAFDGFACVYALDESGAGVSGEYEDSTENGLDGTGGNGVSTFTPSLTDGVFCLDAQEFSGRDFISLPRDSINGGFSVSCWVKTSKSFGEETFYSRGLRDNSHEWHFTLGTSYVNQLMAKIQLDDGGDLSTYACVDEFILTHGKWYHVAATYEPQTALKLYLNGSLIETLALPELSAVAFNSGNTSQIGRANQGAGFTGAMQELRVHHEIKNSDWFTLEHSNFCNTSFHTALTESGIFET